VCDGTKGTVKLCDFGSVTEKVIDLNTVRAPSLLHRPCTIPAPYLFRTCTVPTPWPCLCGRVSAAVSVWPCLCGRVSVAVSVPSLCGRVCGRISAAVSLL
jgi:hypothetical protein